MIDQRQETDLIQDNINGNYVCGCNNCNTLFYDENPQTDQPKFNGYWQPMELLNEDNESFWGCSICKTDGYLVDMTTVGQIKDFLFYQQTANGKH